MGNCQQCNDSEANRTQEILTTRTTKNKQKSNKKLSKLDVNAIVKIQANFRGYVTRKKYQFKLSRSTAQKHSSSIMNQKSSRIDSVIVESPQVKHNTLQVQQNIKKQPIQQIEQQPSKFTNADITINIKDDASSDLSKPASNLVIPQLNGINFTPLNEEDKLIVQTEQQSKLPIMQLQNGAMYEGQWKLGMAHGFGKYMISDSSFYIGDWNQNFAHGFGTFQHSNGDVFMGTWVQGSVNGKGKYTFADGSYYDGEWKNDQPHGIGKQIYGSGWIYEGSFQEGFKCGFGKLTYPDGSIYQGNFENDFMNGNGTLLMNDGRKYTGEWKNGLKSGKGIFEWPDGRKYEGYYLNDLRDGYGILYWPNGQKYLGLWKIGLQHGNGQIVKTNGTTFRGKWIKGKIAQTKLTTNTPAKVVKLSMD